MNFIADIADRIEAALAQNPQALAALKAHARYDEMLNVLEQASPLLTDARHVHYSPITDQGSITILQVSPAGVTLSSFIPSEGYIEDCTAAFDAAEVEGGRLVAACALAADICPPANVVGVVLASCGITTDTLRAAIAIGYMPTVVALTDGKTACAFVMTIFQQTPDWVLDRAA